jgi:hypothetical protein
LLLPECRSPARWRRSSYTLAAPTAEGAEALAAAQLERIEAVLAGAAPDLGNHVLRLDPATGPVVGSADRHMAVGGQPQRYFSNSDAVYAGAVAEAKRNDLVDSYWIIQDVLQGDELSGVDPEVMVQVDRFATEGEAADFLAESESRVSQRLGAVTAEPVGTDPIADGALAYEVKLDFGSG